MEEKLCSHHRPISEDYDSFKPCFFDEVETEEEFYDVPAPSEDIWKKFELLPTPPRSPKHETSYPAPGPSIMNSSLNTTLEKLQMVSDILEPFTLTTDFSMFPEDCALCSRDTLLTACVGLDHDDKELNQNLKSNLIQDCMWSGHLGIALESKVKDLDSTVGTSLSNTDVGVSTTVCVNPQSVFPYPLNEGEAGNAVELEIDTPSDSDDDDDDCDDEDDDDDDDEEEEEAEDEDEEIDVVSVSERHGPISDHRYTVSAPSVSVSAHVAAMHNYTAPHPTTVKSEPLSPASSPVRSQSLSRKRQRSLVGRPSKRPRLTLHLSSHKVKSSRLSAASSRSSSDSEDGSEGTKRSQHNILERKRRNDLKSSFHVLRDHIPELSSQERAPKVVILRKASDYITQLHKTSQLLQAEQERLRLRGEQLKQKLKLLQRH